MAKSMFLTYVLWSIGGFFGLHHIYLGRDAQAFLWWCTLGGYAGCGWLRDIFHIPEYVADANEDKKFIEKHIHRLRTHETVIPITTLLPFITRVYTTSTLVLKICLVCFCLCYI
jgi:TM2 domain-containing membrane protein YozV